MVGIEGITGLPDPASPTRAATRAQRVERHTGDVQDVVRLSTDAQEVSRVAQLLARPELTQTELETERIAQAKENIEQGAYRILSVLKQVAARVSKYIELEDLPQG